MKKGGDTGEHISGSEANDNNLPVESSPCGDAAPPEFSAGESCPLPEDSRSDAGEDPAQATGSPDEPAPGELSKTGTTNGAVPAARERNISWKLFWSFLKIGVFTFGGGYAMIPLIQREVTGNRKWVSNSRFLELLTLAQSAPGPISLNTAVFVGYTLNRYWGAAAAVLGVIVPSFAILLLIAMYFSDIKDNAIVVAVFKGMRPAVVALIVAPLLGFTKGMGPYRIAIALLVAAAIWRLGTSPALLIVLGAAGGILWAYLRKRKEARQ